MKLVLLSVLICVYALVQARPGQVGNADAYLDKVLENARTDPIISSKIDPMIIDDVSFDGGSLTKIKIRGLTSLNRKGPATVQFQGTTIVIEADLGLDRVALAAKYHYKKNWLIQLDGSIGAQVGSIKCRIRLTIEGVRARLADFKVKLSQLKLTKFSGVSFLFNSPVKWILNRIISRNRATITKNIETQSRLAIATALEQVDIHNFLPK